MKNKEFAAMIFANRDLENPERVALKIVQLNSLKFDNPFLPKEK